MVLITSNAQTKTVSGKVTSSEDGSALPGVNVIVQGTTKGTTTNIDGAYSIELGPGENSLSFSFVGFQQQTVLVDNRAVIDISLAPDTQTLQEVVVIGYGVVKKSDLTGAVASVRGEDLTKIPAVSPMQALQGKVAGLQVTSNSGAPGASSVVRIRGTGTFNNANPIYVVDGVILDNIDFLNSGDIESIEVLKDASATAIYGSRGANGVILVTTRKGVEGKEGVTINFLGEYSLQNLQKKIDLLDGREFAIISNEINPGSFNNVDAVPNTDWQDLIFDTAPIQNYQFSASGSASKVQYYVGLGYFKQDGIISKSNYERVTIKLNNTYHLSKSVRLGNNITFTPYRQQNTNGNAPFVVYRAQPVIVPIKPDGSYSEVPGVGNVLADIEYTNNFDKVLRSVGNFYGEVDFLKGFTFRSSFGVDMEYKKNRSFTPEFFVSPQQQSSTSKLTKSYNDRVSWLWENTLTYLKEIDKHRINAVIGYTMQEASSENFEAKGENILRDGSDFWYLNPDNIDPSGIKNEVDANQNYSMLSYLFRANYTFNNRYLFTATYRIDGSSKFSSENRYAGFPSLAVGWNIINEDFIKNLAVLSNLKLRASWGIIGNEKINYKRQFSPVLNGLGGVFGKGDIVYPGSSYGGLGNSDLVWEETHQTDLGLEFGFFDDRLKGELDYYNKKTDGILIDLPIAGYLGNGVGATITYNAAEVLNRGVELNVVWESDWNDLHYRIGGVATSIHNEVLKVRGTGETDDRLFNTDITTSSSPGLPIGSFYGYKTDGLFQNQAELDAYPHLSNAEVGDLRFVDTNNDGLLTSDDRTDLGSPIPDFLYGFSFGLNYKGFDLSADFQGQSGNKIYNHKETIRPDLYNFEQHVFDRWTGEGTSNKEPRATQGGYNWLTSSRFIQDGSFFRLRSVTLGYNIPANLAEKLRMKSARVYLRGTNLFTITNYTGYSPEVTGYSPTNADYGGDKPTDNGIDRSTYPVSVIYSAGINVTF
ncbi:MAG TPA: TonB-dependent receptor [Cyclobacteriaceae bacterium]|nr:TonB-dependent receptor [Cyclobacteriaceae bacterium]